MGWHLEWPIGSFLSPIGYWILLDRKKFVDVRTLGIMYIGIMYSNSKFILNFIVRKLVQNFSLFENHFFAPFVFSQKSKADGRWKSSNQLCFSDKPLKIGKNIIRFHNLKLFLRIKIIFWSNIVISILSWAGGEKVEHFISSTSPPLLSENVS